MEPEGKRVAGKRGEEGVRSMGGCREMGGGECGGGKGSPRLGRNAE